MLNPDTIIHKKYIIRKRIGIGGMSSVWLAEELGTANIWAIKDIDKTSKAFKAMMRADGKLSEVEIVKNLNHPFIPHVNDVYEDDTSIQIVMEYVDGRNLKDILLKRGPIAEPLAIKIVKDLTEIFIYLHTRPDPVIYRDLKPGNVMVQSDGEIRLIDFGVAILMNEDKDRKALGTRGYAAPEQFKGIANAKSDIFTLGATLYSLLTGIIPSEKGYDYSDVLERNPSVSPKLANIITKATSENPDDRYINASEFLKDLVTYNKKDIPVGKIILITTGILLVLVSSLVGIILHSQLESAGNTGDVIPIMEMEGEE